jgi:hypothetical protein
MGNGVSDHQIAARYGLARSSVQRHRKHMGTPDSVAVATRKGMAFTALAALPSVEKVGQAYARIMSRIDAIGAKAEEEKSLAVALMGLRELRSTVTAQAHLAGHLGAPHAAVQVNAQVNVDLGQAVKELIAAIKPAPDPIIPPSSRLISTAASPTRRRSPGWRRSSMPSDLAKEIARRTLYTLSPSAWCRRELKLILDPWQADLIDAPAGRRAISLTHDAIAAAFGSVEGPAPPPPGADPDPVVSRAPAFGLGPSFATAPP